jgi:DNA-binding NarL/FixJ family response regulator
MKALLFISRDTATSKDSVILRIPPGSAKLLNREMEFGRSVSTHTEAPDGSDAVARPRLVLADDHPEIIDELRTLLGHEFEITCSVSNGGELVKAVSELNPDVVITDIYMPGIDGLEASARILKQTPKTVVLMLSMHSEPSLVGKALANGVRGYVLKLDAGEELGPAIWAALKGGIYLSRSIQKV